MTKWHFYQGLNDEWHWYQMDETGDVIASSDGAFDGLDACIRNAREAGFDETEFQVHTPAPGPGGPPRNRPEHA